MDKNAHPAADLIFNGKEAEGFLGFRGADFGQGFGGVAANVRIFVIQRVNEGRSGRRSRRSKLIQYFSGRAADGGPRIRENLGYWADNRRTDFDQLLGCVR